MILRGGSIVEFNLIRPGLNFLVPIQWWNEFLHMNREAHNCDNISVPDQHPLSVLFELGILFLPKNCEETDLARYEEKAHNIRNRLAQTLHHAKQRKFKECELEELEEALRVLDFDKTEQPTRVLLCPQVMGSQIKELMFESFEWRVVNPYIYRAILSKTACYVERQLIKAAVGVPIILDECSELQGFTNRSFTLGPQLETILHFSHAQGVKHLLIGYVERKHSFEELMRHLFEGLNILFKLDELNSNYFTQRNYYVVNQDLIFENFLVGDSEVRKKLREDLHIEPWLDYFAKEVPSRKLEIFQFGGKSRESELSFKRPNESKENYPNMAASKKFKENEKKIAGYIDSYSTSTGFNPTVVSKSEPPKTLNTMIEEEEEKDARKRKNRSSTEEGSPAQRPPKELEPEPDRRAIKYRLWKGVRDVDDLTKLAEAKFDDHITIPDSSSASHTVNLQAGGRVFLGGSPNKLSIDGNGQSFEIQPEESNKADSLMTHHSKFLEGLALEMLGGKDKGELMNARIEAETNSVEEAEGKPQND